MNIELNHAESELQSEEAALHAELTRLAQVSAELSTRMAALQRSASAAGAADIARRSLGAPPPVDADAGFRQAVAAREAAVQARREANAAVRAQVQQVKGQLQKLAQQVVADEKAVLQAKAAAEAAAKTVTAAPVPPPPPKTPTPPRVSAVPQSAPPRRQSPRVRMQAAIDLSSDDNFFNGFSSNISDGGLFVATVNLLPLGTDVDLAFTLPSGERIEAKGTVQWVREVNDKLPDAFPGMGVAFKDLSAQAQEAINGFVAQREPLFYDAA